MSVLMSRSFFLLDGRLLRAADRKKKGRRTLVIYVHDVTDSAGIWHNTGKGS